MIIFFKNLDDSVCIARSQWQNIMDFHVEVEVEKLFRGGQNGLVDIGIFFKPSFGRAHSKTTNRAKPRWLKPIGLKLMTLKPIQLTTVELKLEGLKPIKLKPM